MTRLLVGALAAALNIPTTVSSPAPVVGPPWISIEYPVNPYDAATKDAFLVVHAFHHGQAMAFPVSGTAEGLVSGERRSITLDFQKASRTGEYALRKQWPDQGTWTLVLKVLQGEDGVSAVVDLGADGKVSRVNVPTRRNEQGYVIPARVAMADVDAGLRARAK